MPPERVKMRTALAAIQHAIWSHWMRYMFSCGTFNADGSWTMPAGKVERWKRQMETEFADLTEKEQVSDYDQADKVLKVVWENVWELMPRASAD